MAHKVYLRKKVTSNGRQSLYLDFYPPILNPQTGQLTRREFLGMTLYAEKKEIDFKIKALQERQQNTGGQQSEPGTKRRNYSTEIARLTQIAKKLKPLAPVDRLHNRETLAIAEAIRQRRDNEVNKPEIYTAAEREALRRAERLNSSFLQFFRAEADRRTGSTASNWNLAIRYLESYAGPNIRFADINERFCEGFRDHLATANGITRKNVKLSSGAVWVMFNAFKGALKQAFKDDYIQVDISAKIKNVTAIHKDRHPLTYTEIEALAATPCPDPQLRQTALFTILTGLGHAELRAMKWADVRMTDDGRHYVTYHRQKTKHKKPKAVTRHISEQARRLLGQAGQPSESVFPGLEYKSRLNPRLRAWMEAAGIERVEFCYHDLRATNATWQRSEGAQFQDIADTLNHSSAKMTERYAFLTDEAKRAAADRLHIRALDDL